MPISNCASIKLCEPQFLPFSLVDFSTIMADEDDDVVGSWAFGRSYARGGYCDRRHAHGAVKAPAHMPNLAVFALSSSAL